MGISASRGVLKIYTGWRPVEFGVRCAFGPADTCRLVSEIAHDGDSSNYCKARPRESISHEITKGDDQRVAGRSSYVAMRRSHVSRL